MTDRLSDLVLGLQRMAENARSAAMIYATRSSRKPTSTSRGSIIC